MRQPQGELAAEEVRVQVMRHCVYGPGGVRQQLLHRRRQRGTRLWV